MNSIDLLILHGPPTAGKSSLAQTIARELRNRDVRHAIIELDDLAKIYPLDLLEIMYKNLAAIWPNYEALGEIKIIIPTYLQAGEREIVLGAAPAKRITLCEVTVPTVELKDRVLRREPDEARQQRLLQYIDEYPNNRTPDEFIDFKVSNFNRATEEVAEDIIKQLGWVP